MDLKLISLLMILIVLQYPLCPCATKHEKLSNAHPDYATLTRRQHGAHRRGINQVYGREYVKSLDREGKKALRQQLKAQKQADKATPQNNQQVAPDAGDAPAPAPNMGGQANMGQGIDPGMQQGIDPGMQQGIDPGMQQGMPQEMQQ